MAQEQRLTHQDVKRKYIVYTPTSYAAQTQRQFPLVINYHGGGMTMREQMLYTRMNRTAEREHFIVVYPQGLTSSPTSASGRRLRGKEGDSCCATTSNGLA
ncbi:hypothetical protein ABT364_26860 [Massilia sp. SR12]